MDCGPVANEWFSELTGALCHLASVNELLTFVREQKRVRQSVCLLFQFHTSNGKTFFSPPPVNVCL